MPWATVQLGRHNGDFTKNNGDIMRVKHGKPKQLDVQKTEMRLEKSGIPIKWPLNGKNDD